MARKAARSRAAPFRAPAPSPPSAGTPRERIMQGLHGAACRAADRADRPRRDRRARAASRSPSCAANSARRSPSSPPTSRSSTARCWPGSIRDLDEESPRERLFDVLMRRLELLAAAHEAVRSLLRSARRDPPLALALNGMAVRSQQWMLTAAGIGAAGPKGMVRAQGLALLFANVLRTWVDDDDLGSRARSRRSTASWRAASASPACSTTFAGFRRPPAISASGAPRRPRRPWPARPADEHVASVAVALLAVEVVEARAVAARKAPELRLAVRPRHVRHRRRTCRSRDSRRSPATARVLTARYFSSAFEVLTIWCAVSGPPGGCAMTSPLRIGKVSLPIRTSPSPSSTKNISSLTRWLWNGQARLPGGTTVRL